MASHAHHVELDPARVARDGLAPTLAGGLRFFTAARILGGLFAVGIVGFVLRLSGGFEDRTAWGYYAALFSFLLTTAGSAPFVAIGLRLTRADWRRPIARAAELFGVVGLLLLLMFIPLLYLIPSAEGRRTIWFGLAGAPHLWDTLAVVLLVVCGLLMLYASAVPDLATARDASPPGPRRSVFAWLAGRWRGSARQWALQRGALTLLGAFYFTLLVLVQTLLSTDFAVSLVPGWKDPLFPTYQALTGFQAAVATVVLAMVVLRWVGYKDYLGVDPFWGLAKVLLALSLLWFYFWFSGLIVLWYGRQPVEENILKLFWFGPYLPLFLATFVLNFVGPLLVLMWNPLRRSMVGPAIASAMVIVGVFLDRVRFFVGAFSVEEAGHALEHVPPAHLPDGIDLMLLVGGVGGALFIYVMATRLVPVLSIWEIREGLLLRARSALVKLEVLVLGKPVRGG
ncbi:MAG: hypothetical protein HYY01_12035 [Chloroflexi bacterium]|nr:hypothetical protein [Chloroflexota bacterium]